MSRLKVILIALILCSQAPSALAAEKKAPGERKPTVDRTPPVVNIGSSLAPSKGSLINNSKPAISAEYMDEGTGVDTAATRLFVDGQDVSSGAQVTPNKISYAPPAPLADGSHKVKLDVIDKAGNVDSVTWSFTIHTLPPTVKITSHKPNQFVNRSPIMVSGTVSGPRARIVVNGIAAFVERGAFSARVSLVEGNNTITAVATDAFGNTGSDAVTIVVDTKPPMVDITSPTANSLINTRLVTVTGITDKNAVSVTVGTRAGGEGVPAEVASSSFTARDVKLVEGVNIITAKAVSQAGNAGTATVKVIVDSIAPKIAITSPKDMTVTNRKMITVTGTVDDSTAIVKVNNTQVQVSRGMFTLSGVNLSEGNNTITAIAVDRAGNQAKPAVVTVALDTTPPAAPRIGDLPPVTRVPALAVTGSAEPGARVELFVNSGSKGTVKADDKGAFSLRINLTEGNNAISAVAYDAIGNASMPSAVVNVYLDTKPPKVL